MDRATSLFAEAQVTFGMVQVEFVAAKEVKLVDGEAEFPGNVSPVDGGFSVLWGFLLFSSLGVRHGVVLK